jgi:uncharacterized membrane protein YphA (DoxX/SURF4 family)
MIQIFWVIDFIGLFLGRAILSFFLFKEFLKKEKFFYYLYLILSILIFLGYYSSFAFIFLILLEIFFLIRDLIFRKEKFSDLEFRFSRIALAIVFLFVGPGMLSLDRMFNIRF